MSDLRLSIVAGPPRRTPSVGWWELFERRAAAHPSRTALVAEDVGWTFRELDMWSNRLGHALRAAGAAPGTVVACEMTRSVRSVLGLLAVAKTGATYLPIDPTQPASRVATILDDARPELRLADVPSFEDLAGYGTGPLPRAAEGPAYVIYTSGSTGRPKGVLVGNRSLVNLYRELTVRFFRAGRVHRVAHGLPLAFDASWNPLLWMVGGHEVHLVPNDVRADPERYVHFIRERRLSVVEAVPTQITALIEAGLLADEVRPELLLMGGEAVGGALWSRLRAVPDLTAVNLYGPTECTVFTTACRLDESETPSIGRPIGNTRARVVDAELRPLPVGEPGELLIGGACLAIEYLNLPALTADRFVTLPARWYRTGDLCRCLPDGNLEWLGRLDDQVKIRGHRVEPGEAEHALLALPNVRNAVVRAEGQRLVGYVVLDSGTDAELRDQLCRILPDYLVPSAFVRLDAMPIGPNGKIDRAALSMAADEPVQSEALTPAQELVAASFRALLGISTVNPGSDFFALGGHSLSAAALAARLRAAGAICSLRYILGHPTVAQLAELLPDGQNGTVMP